MQAGQEILSGGILSFCCLIWDGVLDGAKCFRVALHF